MKNLMHITLNAGMLIYLALLIPARDLRAEDPGPGAASVVQNGTKDNGSDLEEAPLDARYDANRQVSRAKWTACGCVGSYFGPIASLLFVASPRIERLMGKSPEYVMLYTRAYKKHMRGQQFRWAALGCATSTCLLTAFLIAANSNNTILDCGPDITCGLNDDCQTMVDNTNACLESSQDCGATVNNCGDNIGDCSPDCSPECNSPDCSPDCNTPECGGSSGCGSSDCGGSSSSCGGSSSNCGSLTETADPDIPLQ